MPACPLMKFATRQINEVRRQLLDAAAFGKHITPDQLEHMASKLAASMEALDLRAELRTGTPSACRTAAG
ncbi:hypothetical protein ABIA39_007522 [Nocardia sp. GAS34]